MGMHFHHRGMSPLDVDVPEPGSGRVEVTVDGDVVELAGPQVGRALHDLIVLATGSADDAVVDVAGVGRVHARDARRVLPQFTNAMLLASAGVERFDRLVPGPADAMPVLCARCGAGAVDPIEVMLDERCLTDGHLPFGTPSDVTWEQAQAFD